MIILAEQMWPGFNFGSLSILNSNISLHGIQTLLFIHNAALMYFKGHWQYWAIYIYIYQYTSRETYKIFSVHSIKNIMNWKMSVENHRRHCRSSSCPKTSQARWWLFACRWLPKTQSSPCRAVCVKNKFFKKRFRNLSRLHILLVSRWRRNAERPELRDDCKNVRRCWAMAASSEAQLTRVSWLRKLHALRSDDEMVGSTHPLLHRSVGGAGQGVERLDVKGWEFMVR